ncbi:Scr1 family TA system antitoxin-like transcriptional regulator [Nocardiopsis flavescens]|uniref:Scr1 family TA system antitoxin-like transcriptional regulator n=1 Tax=Nocardiopsis flavescens TaxID=758803 RepID=UPI003653ADA4
MPLNPFAEALVEYRELAGLTQTQLAKRVGVSVSSVNRWEHGHSPPKRDNVEKLDESCNAGGKIVTAWQAHTSRSGLPEWARDLAAIEPASRHATLITAAGVPGLLQCESYALAVFRSARPTAKPEDLADLIALRTGRLASLPDLTVTAVFPAMAVGGLPTALCRDQAKHLLTWAESGRVTICLTPPTATMLVPPAPVMIYSMRSGERIFLSDHADGTVLLHAESAGRMDAMTTAVLMEALPAASSLEYLESLV